MIERQDIYDIQKENVKAYPDRQYRSDYQILQINLLLGDY